MSENYLVTGAMGCIGAWVVHNLVQNGTAVTAFDLSDDPHRLRLIMAPADLEKVTFVQGDITQTNTVKETVSNYKITHIIHLAGLQVPFCKADPVTGAAVNVIGTINIFEAAKAAGIKHLTFASSVAVYGRPDEYEEKLLSHNAALIPHNHYGVYKQANENTARIYWQDDGISSIGLRPYTLYGPGRDQGMTSTPTKAMLAAAKGEAYHISYGGYNGFQYTDDIAKIFIAAAQTKATGAETYNIKGSVAHMSDVVAAIEAAAPETKGSITFEDVALALPEGQDGSELEALFGRIPHTPLNEGIAQTVAHFKHAIADGKL